MSEEQSIFEADPASPVAQVVTPNPVDELPPEVAELVGEGKKYRTAADALKALPHAQSHIQKIEADNAALKAQLESSKAMEELLAEFKQQGVQPTGAQQGQPAASQPVDINQAVEAALARKEAQNKAQANADAVIGAFTATFGAEGEARFIQTAQENGMTVATLNALAKTSPEAVLKLAGLKKGTAPTVPHSTPSVNTQANLNINNEISAKVPLVGASTKDVLNAWKNAGIKAERLRNS